MDVDRRVVFGARIGMVAIRDFNERGLLELCSGVGAVVVEFRICTSTSTSDPFWKNHGHVMHWDLGL